MLRALIEDHLPLNGDGFITQFNDSFLMEHVESITICDIDELHIKNKVGQCYVRWNKKWNSIIQENVNNLIPCLRICKQSSWMVSFIALRKWIPEWVVRLMIFVLFEWWSHSNFGIMLSWKYCFLISWTTPGRIVICDVKHSSTHIMYDICL